MDRLGQFDETIANYTKHGWRLRRVLVRPETSVELAKLAGDERAADLFAGATVEDSEVDALWFARASHNNREAWELRLVAEPPYALFETFEPDETEEEREELRREMEARMRDYAARR